MNHEDETKLIAYRIWEAEGCPDGLHQEHWVRAETTWREEYMQAAVSASSKPKARKPSAKKKRSTSTAKRSKR